MKKTVLITLVTFAGSFAFTSCNLFKSEENQEVIATAPVANDKALSEKVDSVTPAKTILDTTAVDSLISE